MAGERPKQIPYRWTAQDAAAARQTPAAIATPYGIDPAEVFASTGKAPPNDKRWASAFIDGESVSLPASACRLPWLLDQFSVPGHTWEEAPKDLQAATLGELCQKLADRSDKYAVFADFSSKAPAPATSEARRTVAERKNLIAKKLFWYWGNTDYRWAVLHSGVSPATIDAAPETLPTQAKGTADAVSVSGALTWVLAKEEARLPIGAPLNVPKADAEKKTTTIVVPKSGPLTALPPGSPLHDLHAELLDTLARSFVDRLAGLPLSGENLMYGFRRDEPPPPNLGVALMNLGPSAVNFLVRMFDRMRTIDGTFALWRQVKYIRNQWWGGSGGMKVIYYAPAAMRSLLDGLLKPSARPTVARDAYLGSLEHQSSASWKLAPKGVWKLNDADQEPPDCNTWREVDTLGSEAMHFCVDKGDLKGEERTLSHDDIHIDWVSPVDGIRKDKNQCTYALDTGATHWAQAMVGHNMPVFNFDVIQNGIENWRAQILRSTRAADFRDFVKRWQDVCWKLVVQGRAGHEKAQSYRDEILAMYESTLPDPPPPRPGVRSF